MQQPLLLLALALLPDTGRVLPPTAYRVVAKLVLVAQDVEEGLADLLHAARVGRDR